MQAYVILRPPPGGRRISTSTRLPAHPLIAAPLAATLPPELSATATPSPQLSATATPSPKSVIPEGDLLFLDFGTFAAPPIDQHPQPPPCPPRVIRHRHPLPKVCHPRRGSAFSCSLPLPFAPHCCPSSRFCRGVPSFFFFGRLHPHSHPMPPLIRRIPQSFEHKPHISNNPNRLQNII